MYTRKIIHTLFSGVLLLLAFFAIHSVTLGEQHAQTFVERALSTLHIPIAEAMCYNPNNPGGYCDAIDGQCAPTHYNCISGGSFSPVDGPTSWTWGCRKTGPYGINDYCTEQKIPTAAITASPSAAYPGTTISVNWNTTIYAYCKVSVFPATIWYHEWVGTSGSFTMAMPDALSGGAPTFTLSCGTNSSTLSSVGSASVAMIRDGMCGSTAYSCLYGTSVNNTTDSVNHKYLWGCAGANGGTTASCSLQYATCAATHYNCTVGTALNQVDAGSSWTWACQSTSGISSAITSCAETKPPANGVCATTHYNCAAGTSVNGYQSSDRWLWDCDGLYGGTNVTGCYEMLPVNGVCSSVHYGCNAGTSVTNVESASAYTWTCNGLYGGTNTSCTEYKPPVNGSCAATHYSCTKGNSVNNTYDASTYTYTWNCNGANGGTTASCSEIKLPPPIDGKCAYYPPPSTSQMHYSCSAGTSVGAYDAGTTWNWNCAGLFSGATVTCSENKPVNGVCGASHYSCSAGTSASNVDGVASWTWLCNGLYGGSGANCAEAKPATVAWTPPSATIDYNTKTSYSYLATNAVTCNYDDIDTVSGVVTNIWTNGPTFSPWVGPQGPYTKDVHRRVTCKNSDGKLGAPADFYLTVRQNDATCGAITVSSYLLPGEHFNAKATMNNTGTNPWTSGFPANYVLWTADNTWSWNTLNLTNSPVSAGTIGSFQGSLVAPTTEGDYGFSWQMRPIFAGTPWPVFGTLCNPTTPNGNKLRVKVATLGVKPQTYQFSDTVLGDSPSTVQVPMQNLGGGTITGIKLGNIVAPFSCISNCNLQLGPGEAAKVTLAFTPTATGTFSQNAPISNTNNNPTVPIVDSVTGQPVDHIYIYGNGTDKYSVTTDTAGLSPIGTIDFGDVGWTLSKFMNLTIHNRSKEKSGTINPHVDLPSAYSCVKGCGITTLAPGGSKTIQLKFAPQNKQNQTYLSTFHVGDTPDVQLPITGNGVKPEFSTQEK